MSIPKSEEKKGQVIRVECKLTMFAVLTSWDKDKFMTDQE